MLGKKITPTFQPTAERSMQSHTNPHHAMHDEQINKPMDDWIDTFNLLHIAETQNSSPLDSNSKMSKKKKKEEKGKRDRERKRNKICS